MLLHMLTPLNKDTDTNRQNKTFLFPSYHGGALGQITSTTRLEADLAEDDGCSIRDSVL